MKKKTIVSIILSVAILAGITGVVLGSSCTSCDRYLVNWWGTHSPTNRLCTKDYYTYEGWGMYGLNCANMFDYASYCSWRSLDDADGEWTGSDEWDFYIPWNEINPVDDANYYFYNKIDEMLKCIGTIDHYSTYGWENPDCPCVAEGIFGQCDCFGVAGWWDKDNDRLILSDCGYPHNYEDYVYRMYADSARVSW